MDPTLSNTEIASHGGRSGQLTPPLNSTVAHASVAGDPPTVYAAAYNLVQRLWPNMTEIVLADPPHILMHRVSSAGDDVDAWLTWDFRPTGPSASWTELRLVHEELDTSAGPPPELDQVLGLLVESLRPALGYA